MASGALVALFFGLVLMLGGMSAFAFVIAWRASL